MPEYVVALIASAILGAFGFITRKIDTTDSRIDTLELKIAETYVTKDDLRQEHDHIYKTLTRIEEKLDAHIFGDSQLLSKLRQKYHHD